MGCVGTFVVVGGASSRSACSREGPESLMLVGRAPPLPPPVGQEEERLASGKAYCTFVVTTCSISMQGLIA